MILNLPYSALRAFEAVVRHSGFSPAAEELGVSQSAVSQHVRTLEEWLGRDLLVRGARQSRPTRDGEQLALAITEGLGRISDVCAQLRDRTRTDRTIVISCLPGFAFNWLFPRLLHFDLAHPDLSISIATDTGRYPFSGTDSDIGIRYGIGEYQGFQVDLLMGERLFPVCAPALLPKLTCIEDLSQHTLLVDENLHHGASSPTWEFWARQTELTLPSTVRTRRLGQSNMVVQAAIEGLGVALGRESLVIDALCDGRLVRPFPYLTQSPLSYWLVRRPETQDSPKVGEFLKWIKSEANSQPDLPPLASQSN
ncbi:transcriptional regulator, LysR family [Ruegeria halocynthiae]|uniref:Transcriptional regulator, LysR family n=1 Tax=Ruegeria halocynthiae TaxID=985054 RepID=A0A1H2XVD5_9RHOB|nr:LysR substrate-binding domain-containing protein [Ruegeria halocynthiae]SDW96932.1 transcriptional regulator, LysR family [Ruegeria halocynthiae]